MLYIFFNRNHLSQKKSTTAVLKLPTTLVNYNTNKQMKMIYRVCNLISSFILNRKSTNSSGLKPCGPKWGSTNCLTNKKLEMTASIKMKRIYQYECYRSSYLMSIDRKEYNNKRFVDRIKHRYYSSISNSGSIYNSFYGSWKRLRSSIDSVLWKDIYPGAIYAAIGFREPFPRFSTPIRSDQKSFLSEHSHSY
uniref:Uncharacterized protein n=1 Tax=Utricularia reniformis TaxID=192314 RepID=A0A1Y0B4Q9_9LAMI|nr:hypothetical protein AEK19_MT2266 [Utricularia reniformis]ART32411.1 hypothetical protein AEK19_MT2266 [Utricularia reniformis]